MNIEFLVLDFLIDNYFNKCCLFIYEDLIEKDSKIILIGFKWVVVLMKYIRFVG